MMYVVQVRKEHKGYVTRCATDKWNQAVLVYNGINIGAPYTKRLVEVCDKHCCIDGNYKVISRAKGS
jgi:hypothetical protein